ncbi:MAG: ScpA family protein [Candidatus Micrarchaeia archaeon]
MAEIKPVQELEVGTGVAGECRRDEEAEATSHGQIQIGIKDGHLEIEDLVVNPTWKDILMDLVISEQFDPWNLDIVQITSKYLERVKRMSDLDLHIPANVILAASILLRLKSETLKLESEEQIVENETYIDDQPIGEVQMLHLRMRVPPKRSITLADLVNALEEVMSMEKAREQKAREKINFVELKIPKYDIEKEMEFILERARKFADEKGWLTFTSLLKGKPKNNETIILAFLPLLFLESENKVFLLQEKLFGEILINVNPDPSSAPRSGGGKEDN